MRCLQIQRTRVPSGPGGLWSSESQQHPRPSLPTLVLVLVLQLERLQGVLTSPQGHLPRSSWCLEGALGEVLEEQRQVGQGAVAFRHTSTLPWVVVAAAVVWHPQGPSQVGWVRSSSKSRPLVQRQRQQQLPPLLPQLPLWRLGVA